MPTSRQPRSTPKSKKPQKHLLRLFVAGGTQRASSTIEAVKSICAEHFPDRYELEIVDVRRHPALLREEQIIATPTLLRRLPEPLRKLVGELGNRAKVVQALELLDD